VKYLKEDREKRLSKIMEINESMTKNLNSIDCLLRALDEDEA